MMYLLKSVYQYRGFIKSSIAREFKTKYQMSLLGSLWLILQPLAMIVVYTVIFSEIMKARMPGSNDSFAYSIYLCSGLLTWGFFSETVLRLQAVFVENANYLKKINFPRICLPIISVGSAFVNFFIIFIIYIVFTIITDNFPGINILAIIPLLILQTLFAIGLGITLGVLNVFFRDVGQFMQIVIQFWFWFSPIIYLVNILPEWAHSWVMWNPMVGIIMGYHDIFVNKSLPDWSNLTLAIILTIVFLFLGLFLFRKHSGDMVDEL